MSTPSWSDQSRESIYRETTCLCLYALQTCCRVSLSSSLVWLEGLDHPSLGGTSVAFDNHDSNIRGESLVSMWRERESLLDHTDKIVSPCLCIPCAAFTACNHCEKWERTTRRDATCSWRFLVRRREFFLDGRVYFTDFTPFTSFGKSATE